MKSAVLEGAKIFAIQLFFATTFYLSAWVKWSQGVPDWFIKQFQGTWLAHLPGGLATTYDFLAVLESIGCLGCLVSLLRLEFLPKPKPALQCVLTFSLFVFLILAYGSRLTGKFDIAAYNLIYFLGALLCLREVSSVATKSSDASGTRS